VVGHSLRPTKDLFTAPWCFIIEGQKGADLRPVAAQMRQLLRVNHSRAVLRRAAVYVRDFWRRLLGRIERRCA
jgi:hypothetical protein